ncbi:alkylated DNA repair protein alkB homolog 8-like [Suricata suricatta]|nr:alkylated DNA repair protein alkB homolog 8-like [Suricata suricatta]
MEQEYNEKKSKYLRENRTSPRREEGVSSRSSGAAVLVEQVPDAGPPEPARQGSPLGDFQEGGRNSRKATSAKLPVHTNRTSFHSQDLLVPWHLKGHPGNHKPAEPLGRGGPQGPSPVFHRFYHVFREGELEAACRTLSDIRVLRSYYDQGNWCVVLEKV